MNDRLPTPDSLSAKTSRLFYGYVIVAAFFFIMIAVFMGSTAFGVFFKPVSESFGWSRAAMSAAFSLSSIIMGISAIILGGLSDRLGPRIILTVSGLMGGAGLILSSQVSSLWNLYLFYGLIYGIGMGGTYAPVVTTVMRWFDKRRGLMVGLTLVGLGIGSIVGPPLANMIIVNFGWQQSYIILGIAVMVVMVTAAQFLKRDPAVMGLKPYGASSEKIEAVEASKGFSLREAMRTRQFWTIAAIQFFSGYTIFSIMIHLVPLVTDLLIPEGTAALMMAMLGAASIPGRLLMGAVNDRIGSRKVFMICFTIFALDLLLLLLTRNVIPLFIFSALFGFAFGGVQSSESPLVAWLFGTRSMGSVFGVMVFTFSAGTASGTLLAGYIYDVFSSYSPAIMVIIGMAVTALLLTTSLKPLKSQIQNIQPVKPSKAIG